MGESQHDTLRNAENVIDEMKSTGGTTTCGLLAAGAKPIDISAWLFDNAHCSAASHSGCTRIQFPFIPNDIIAIFCQTKIGLSMYTSSLLDLHKMFSAI